MLSHSPHSQLWERTSGSHQAQRPKWENWMGLETSNSRNGNFLSSTWPYYERPDSTNPTLVVRYIKPLKASLWQIFLRSSYSRKANHDYKCLLQSILLLRTTFEVGSTFSFVMYNGEMNSHGNCLWCPLKPRQEHKTGRNWGLWLLVMSTDHGAQFVHAFVQLTIFSAKASIWLFWIISNP